MKGPYEALQVPADDSRQRVRTGELNTYYDEVIVHNGKEILQELCGHLNFDLDTVSSANCIPCRMPYITSMFMPRAYGDRPLPVPKNSKNLAFVSQFVEIPDDVVFTV
ncbi:oleate hydratase [Phormidium pseudopriestleyi FRX01]|uniref:Oleate hydratase n=1 Tax=Phormidium pseudopriestleyi FRX01 TaxID=1759528 RepID=A0ABS3FY92_9CYAN|nr:oleate hydratase [Phormidium pseudopriestleyi]MBO0351954.1 oleate hydratase [Phormidium pseudopriestleyi FRX01]